MQISSIDQLISKRVASLKHEKELHWTTEDEAAHNTLTGTYYYFLFSSFLCFSIH